jgi:hypothetical protein
MADGGPLKSGPQKWAIGPLDLKVGHVQPLLVWWVRVVLAHLAELLSHITPLTIERSHEAGSLSHPPVEVRGLWGLLWGGLCGKAL